jgi:GT2 family glycosyltransferase
VTSNSETDGKGLLAPRLDRVAVLLACHNRRDMTLTCLRSLFMQRAANIRLSVFLVDDGSRDGTTEAVAREFPDVTIVQGSGQLYWGGGMRLAFHTAALQDADFHLWLNDDVVLSPDAVRLLLTTYEDVHRRRPQPIIVAGAVEDPATRAISYSGHKRRSSWHPLRFDPVEPGPVPKLCDTMSGNVVLVSRDVFKRLGAIDQAFVHTMGDCDYGLRLRRIGGDVWLASRYVGTCPKGDRHSARGSISNRLRDIGSSKKLPPLPWLVYVRRHGGSLWPILWAGPYLKVAVDYAKEIMASGVKRVSHR